MSNGFEAYTLCSSSKGNSVYIKCGNTRFLIDAGRPMRAIEQALNAVGTCLAEIDAIFVTHAHSDHTKGLYVIGSHYDMPIHMTSLCCEEFLSKNADMRERITPHDVRFCISANDVKIHSFVTPHDSEESVGYIVEYSGDAPYTFGVCTDTGCISREMVEELMACNGCIVESNYDETMLAIGPYPNFLKKRISANTGHLSNTKCSELVTLLARAGVTKFMLAHLSPENNLPDLALRRSCKALIQNGFDNVDITVADKLTPTRF